MSWFTSEETKLKADLERIGHEVEFWRGAASNVSTQGVATPSPQPILTEAQSALRDVVRSGEAHVAAVVAAAKVAGKALVAKAVAAAEEAANALVAKNVAQAQATAQAAVAASTEAVTPTAPPTA